MATTQASTLSHITHERMEQFKRLCENVDEETASHASSGRWSPKEIVSHLCGPEETRHMSTFRAILDEDTPLLDIKVEDPFFTEKRASIRFRELLAKFEREYRQIADFAHDLSDEQLSRKAHIPMLKETPVGEYPTLAQWISVIGDHHLGSHTDHMREILEELGDEK